MNICLEGAWRINFLEVCYCYLLFLQIPLTVCLDIYEANNKNLIIYIYVIFAFGWMDG